MKKIYCILLLLSFLMITSCQQQQVPEIFYDFNAKDVLSKTRAMKQLVLYQAPLEMFIDKELQLFYGRIDYLETDDEDQNNLIKVKVKNEIGVVIEFDVSLEVAALMDLEMNLAIRYIRDDKQNTAVEIKKAAW